MKRLALLAILAACGGGSAYPASADVPDLAFDGAEGTIRLRDYWEPNASRVLMIRVEGGAWCGTCLWQAAHTREIFALPKSDRLRVLDLVIGDRDNAPARAADALAWRAELDAPERVDVAADPAFSLRALAPADATVLPLVVLIDTRTMHVVSATSNPSPTELARAVDAAFAAEDGVAPAEIPDEPLVDGIFRRNEWDMIRAMRLPEAPPPDPTDAVADDPRAAALGKALFFDTGLSPAGVACASCHAPDKDLSDDLARGKGAATGDRKTPRIALAAFSRFQFWDGRADSLWSQALGPIESPSEMGSSRARVAQRIATTWPSLYAAAFPSHDLRDETRVFVDAGKAIEAYERTLRVAPNALDAYASGDFTALTLLQKQGLSVFAGAGCMQCHWGPRLTDDAFHVTRTPTGRADGAADLGRAAVRPSEFSASGPFSDDPSAARPCRVGTLGAFKTPSLRGVADTTFFGHGGARAALSDVLDEYGAGGLDASDPRAAGAREPWLPRFGETTRWSIGTFLATLSARPIVP